MKKILIVDDDVTILNLLSQVLEKKFKVYASVGVNDALWIVDRVELDAICSDYNMKDGTGLEFLKSVRRKDKKMPFLLMSGDEDDFVIRMVKHLGANFCRKTDPGLISQIIALVD